MEGVVDGDGCPVVSGQVRGGLVVGRGVFVKEIGLDVYQFGHINNFYDTIII